MLTSQEHSTFQGTNVRKLQRQTHVRTRPIRATDAAALQAGVESMSDQSRYFRFHSGLKRLPEHVLRYLTEVDGVNHVALVAIEFGQGVAAHGVGVGRFVRDPKNPTQAELALTVTDRAQGRGIGRRLLSDLAKAASAVGIETFTMTVISSNAPARRLLSRVGAIGRGSASDVMSFHLPLSALRLAA